MRTTKSLDLSEKKALLQLWNSEYPERIEYKSIEDFEGYLSGLSGSTFYLLESSEGAVMGWASTFLRDNEIWFALIISSALHGKGYGSKLLSELKKDHKELNGWVIDNPGEVKKDGTLYRSPLPFYQKMGFEVLSDIRLEIPTLSAVKITWSKDS